MNERVVLGMQNQCWQRDVLRNPRRADCGVDFVSSRVSAVGGCDCVIELPDAAKALQIVHIKYLWEEAALDLKQFNQLTYEIPFIETVCWFMQRVCCSSYIHCA
jgi:hypothetical protein